MAAPYVDKCFIEEPPYCRFKTLKREIQENLPGILNILRIFSTSHIQNDKILSEFKLLKAMINRRNRQLRRAKPMRFLKQIRTCLKRVNQYEKVYKLLLDIMEDVQSAIKEVTSGNSSCYLPAQQTWTYLLYLLSIKAQLLEKTQIYCIAAFEELSRQFVIGWLIPQMLTFMGIVARIWLLSRTLEEKTITFYNSLHPFIKLIDSTQSAWKEPVLSPQLFNQVPSDSSVNLMESYSSLTEQSKTVGLKFNETESLSKNLAFQAEEDLGEPLMIHELDEQPNPSTKNAPNERPWKGELKNVKKNKKRKIKMPDGLFANDSNNYKQSEMKETIHASSEQKTSEDVKRAKVKKKNKEKAFDEISTTKIAEVSKVKKTNKKKKVKLTKHILRS
ncbi:uncharacterized protein LOC131940786 [Physella acuta]|uniref:uncharacterized protein LOC131940786 n=1 Tax=Physella acuta TaxID=109671 RepID=UPI0027DD2A3D|nr:uncharacterized protein LOC131940786 [Physella acuta]